MSKLPKGMASRGGRGGRGGRVSGGAPAPTKSDVKDVKKVEAGPRKKVGVCNNICVGEPFVFMNVLKCMYHVCFPS